MPIYEGQIADGTRLNAAEVVKQFGRSMAGTTGVFGFASGSVLGFIDTKRIEGSERLTGARFTTSYTRVGGQLRGRRQRRQQPLHAAQPPVRGQLGPR